MNIQIFGKAKCFDTKKAERYFKERRIKYQFVDILKYGMSRGELNSVKNAVGLDAMADPADQDYPLFQYLASAEAKLDKLYEVPYLIKTPIVRNGKQLIVCKTGSITFASFATITTLKIACPSISR